MDATSWWTGEEAKTNGFVDELVDDGEKTVVENPGRPAVCEQRKHESAF